MIDHTATIAAAYLGNNTVAADHVPEVIQIVHTALNQLGGSTEPVAAARPHPAVSIRKSVTPESITCLDCGFSGQMIRRHLTTAHGLSVEQYRERWGLAPDYPVVAPKLREEAVHACQGDRSRHRHTSQCQHGAAAT
jgi:predicted transcriptional regulator